MPIGKNSIKRVANGGYSEIKTSAPDMENSTVAPISEPAPAPVAKPRAERAKAATPRAAEAPKPQSKVGRPRKAAPTARSERKPAAATPKKSASAPKTQGKAKTPLKKAENPSKIAIGSELPIYLL